MNSTTELYHRKGSRYWQARFRVAGELVRRSTGTTLEAAARDGLRSWKLQIARRGAPRPAEIRAPEQKPLL